MTQPSNEPDELVLSIQIMTEQPTLIEIADAISVIDNAWALAYRLTAIDEFLRTADEIAVLANEYPGGMPSILIKSREIADLTVSLDDLDDVPRPEATVRRESPLSIELVDYIGAGLTGVASIGVWQAFKYIVDNAERVASVPQRLRFGWHSGRAEADDARIRALNARRRLELEKLELARTRRVTATTRDLRRLGRIETESTFPDDPGALF